MNMARARNRIPSPDVTIEGPDDLDATTGAAGDDADSAPETNPETAPEAPTQTAAAPVPGEEPPLPPWTNVDLDEPPEMPPPRIEEREAAGMTEAEAREVFGGTAEEPAQPAGGGAGGGAPSLDFASMFTNAERDTTGGDGPKAARKARKSADAITPEKRAKAAIFGGGFATMALNGVARLLGSTTTVDSFSGPVGTRIQHAADRFLGVALPPGIPLDYIEDENGIPLVQELSVVITMHGTKPRIVRCVPGRAQLLKDERIAVDPERPQDGETVITVFPANAAHAIAYNLASGPLKFIEKAEAWLESHEEAVRGAYAGVIAAAFIDEALRNKK